MQIPPNDLNECPLPDIHSHMQKHINAVSSRNDDYSNGLLVLKEVMDQEELSSLRQIPSDAAEVLDHEII